MIGGAVIRTALKAASKYQVQQQQGRKKRAAATCESMRNQLHQHHIDIQHQPLFSFKPNKIQSIIYRWIWICVSNLKS